MHRDIKPTNILVSNNKKTLKLCDFGFARRCDGMKRSLTMCGSPLYMAPEIYKKSGYSGSVDIWSLGIILFEMLFGYHPLSEYNDVTVLSKSLISENDSILIPSQPRVSDDCVNLLSKMLEKNTDNRITISELLTHKWLDDSEKITEFENNIYRDDNDNDNGSFKPSYKNRFSCDNTHSVLFEMED
jgi:serine/threonine protein kinase